jgi:hypothetical protein
MEINCDSKAATIQRAATTRKDNITKRNHRLIEEFNRLYQEQRIRYDDVIDHICDTYNLSQRTANRILKTA